MATRKTATKTASKKVSDQSSKTQNISSSKLKGIRLKDLILPIGIFAVAVLIWFMRDQVVVATVNGQPITRLAVISELEKKDGKTVLDSLVTENLILQEAQKRGISVSDQDVQNEISKIEKSITSQGQNLDMVLAQQGMTRTDLNRQIKLQLLLKKMVGTVSVTAKEVQDYMTQNKDSLPESTDEAQLMSQIKAQLEQQKIGEKIQTFVASLQSKAKINYLHSY